VGLLLIGFSGKAISGSQRSKAFGILVNQSQEVGLNSQTTALKGFQFFLNRNKFFFADGQAGNHAA